MVPPPPPPPPSTPKRRLIDECDEEPAIALRPPARQDSRLMIFGLQQSPASVETALRDNRSPKYRYDPKGSVGGKQKGDSTNSNPYTVRWLHTGHYIDDEEESKCEIDLEMMSAKKIMYSSPESNKKNLDDCDDTTASCSAVYSWMEGPLPSLSGLCCQNDTVASEDSSHPLCAPLSPTQSFGFSRTSSSFSEIPEPPPLHQHSHRQNISSPGAFRISALESNVDHRTNNYSNNYWRVVSPEEDEDEDAEEDYSFNAHVIPRSPSPLLNDYYESNDYLVEAILVEEDSERTSTCKQRNSDHFTNEPTENSERTATADLLVEAEPLKNRRACLLFFMFTLAFFAMALGGTLGVNYDNFSNSIQNDEEMMADTETSPTLKPSLHTMISQLIPEQTTTTSLSLLTDPSEQEETKNSNATDQSNDDSQSLTQEANHSISEPTARDTTLFDGVITQNHQQKLTPKLQNNGTQNYFSLATKSRSPTPVPTTAHSSMAPTAMDFIDTLPKVTRRAMNNPNSPQSKAYGWVLQDPNFDIYPNPRRLQRFALATFYHSTNGDTSWTKHKSDGTWLSYSYHECDWYTDEMTGIICDNDNWYETLHLHGGDLSGTIPPELFLLTSLVKLDCSGNSISGTIPKEISQLNNLRIIDLYMNNLIGSIPSEINTLGYLKYIDLEGNMLDKSMPVGFSNLSNLRVASFLNNQLTGYLPTYAFSTALNKRIDYLDFGMNQFSGTLPSEIGLLSTATMLDFSVNEFHGTLPTELGQLRRIKHLFLHDNANLRGDIPSEIGQLVDLEVLWLHQTNIWGIVPDEVCSLFDKGKLEDLSVNCIFVQCYCGCTCRII